MFRECPAIALLFCAAVLLGVCCEGSPQKAREGHRATGSLHKTGRTFYTDERIAIGRQNISHTSWGPKLRRRILDTGDSIGYYVGPEYTAAEVYARQTDDFLWSLQPPTTIPRVIDPPASVARCPLHGEAVRQIDSRCPWRIDPVGHPYQIQCPVGGEWYPSNRYDRGDLTSGPYADDGNGFQVGGIRYFPLREYCHMVYGTVVIPTLRSLSQAYLLTGDPRYAHKGCVLLARLASVYPNYGWEGDDPALENRFDRTYLGPWGNQDPNNHWKHGGLITDCIWESYALDALAYVYDAFYDYLDDDPELIRLLRARGLSVGSGAELRAYIETYILRAGMRALEAKWVWGNEGHHQSAALSLALVLDDHSDRHPNSQDMVDYAYRGIGQAAYILTNGLTRDGGGYESPSYNLYNLRFIAVARSLEALRKLHPDLYPLEKYPDIFAQPKAPALFDYYIDMVQQDHQLPSIGDIGGIGPPKRREGYANSILGSENLFAAVRYASPRLARACTDAEGRLVDGELWQPYPEEEITALLKRPGAEIKREDRFLDGYGVMILETDSSNGKTTVALNYSSLRGHFQGDHLSFGLIRNGLDLLPDLGYPLSWDYRLQWESNSLSHNTVTVDESQPDYRSIHGRGRILASAGGVHLAVASHEPYPDGVGPGAPPVQVFERSLLLVETDEGEPYLVDLFLVNGGEQHDQSWHGMQTPVQSPALPWRLQAKGTLAGEKVPEWSGYTDRWGRSHPQGSFPSYLSRVRRAPLEAPARWRWESGLVEKDFLDLFLIPAGGPAEVIQASGRSPIWGERRLDYLILRRQAQRTGPSRFLSVLAPGQGQPAVRDVRLIANDPLTLQVIHGTGRDQIELYLGRGIQGAPVGLVGARVLRDGPGGRLREIRLGDCRPGVPGMVRSQVSAVDRAGNAIVCPCSEDDASAFAPGVTIRLYNDKRSSLWSVVGVERQGPKVRLRLDRTSVAAMGPVIGADDATVHLNAGLPFATSSLDNRGLRIWQDAYEGTVLEAGTTALRVKAATQSGVIILEDPGRPGELSQAIDGGIARLYEYGTGDSLELVRTAVLEQGR